MKPIFESKFLGNVVRVFPKYVEYGLLGTYKTIPKNQIASVNIPWGAFKIVIETTGGEKISIPTKDKIKVREAILDYEDEANTGSPKKP